MVSSVYWILIPILTFLGAALGWVLKWLKARIKLVSSEKIASRRVEEILQEAYAECEKMRQEGKSQLESEKELMAEEIDERKRELEKLEQQLKNRNGHLRERESALAKVRNAITERENHIVAYEKSTLQLKKDFQHKLEKISETTQEEMKNQIKENLINQEKRDAQHVIGRREEESQRNAEINASEILVSAMERLPIDQIIEHSPTVIEAPTQEMVGRLISREGRFIRILESLLDVELSIEDTWEGFNLSSPDPIKREIAKATMDRLFKGGRITPEKIEDTVRVITKEVNQTMESEAKRLLQELEIHDLKEEAVKALGRLLFRYSYGQNMLYHSKEVALLSSMLAEQLGADPIVAKRGGLLHDIGKGFALDGKAHVEIGVELGEKWGEDPKVINCIASHHDDVEQTCLEATIVQIADAISGSRPGARRETISSYLERVEKLESIAEGLQGVDKAFAIYAGRELRILVNSEQVDDEATGNLAAIIVKKIEEELSYPGKIKVTVIREVKSSTYTR